MNIKDLEEEILGFKKIKINNQVEQLDDFQSGYNKAIEDIVNLITGKEDCSQNKTVREEIARLELGFNRIAKAQRILSNIDLDRLINELDN